MFVTTHGIELFVETFGRPEDPALLLLMGNSAPGLMWPDAFCAMLAEGGLRVIRFDQRDTGLSTYLDFDATPYDLDDLGRDALGLLDALGVGRCHVAGLSQGGFLAYRLALQAPERLASLTALMSSPDLRPKNDAFAGAPPRPGELPRHLWSPCPSWRSAYQQQAPRSPTSSRQVTTRFMRVRSLPRSGNEHGTLPMSAQKSGWKNTSGQPGAMTTRS